MQGLYAQSARMQSMDVAGLLKGSTALVGRSWKSYGWSSPAIEKSKGRRAKEKGTGGSSRRKQGSDGSGRERRCEPDIGTAFLEIHASSDFDSTREKVGRVAVVPSILQGLRWKI